MEHIIAQYDALLIPGAKLSFQTVHNVELSSKDLTLLQLTSSSILEGRFQNTVFYNASFLSTKFSNVVFEYCNLKCTDICSIWAKDCVFNASDFSDANVSDSTFIRCTFDRTMFERISMLNCQFIDCVFEQFPISDSSLALNTFTRCIIKNTNFTESFYYQIFEDCTFRNVDMPISLLGFNFGFSEEVFKQLKNGADFSMLEDDFLKKGLLINAAILRVNQVKDYYNQAMIACAVALKKMIQSDILVKADEIRFLKEITMYLEKQGKLVPASILQIWQILSSLTEEKRQNTSAGKAFPYIQEYANTLYFSFQKFQEQLQEKLDMLPKWTNPAETAVLKIVFTVAPELSLLSLLRNMTAKLCPQSPAPELIRTEHGSFIAIHKIATIIIPYLQTLFAFLGVVSPFVVHHLENRRQTLKTEENDSQSGFQLSKTPSQITVETKTSIALPNKAIISTSTNVVISGTVQIINEIKILDSPDFAGYNPQNIQSITVSECM